MNLQKNLDADEINANVVEIRGFEARPKVITLCGSTRFWEQFQEANAFLTQQGNVVFSVAVPSYSGDAEMPEEKKAILDKVHLHKIRMSDEILVLNVEGYIGESTRKEIQFAESIGRKVRYLEDTPAGPLFE